jgi:two-component system response regulator FixJ
MTDKAASDVPVISIIDDDESVREALLFLMKSVGLNAEIFGSAKDFLTDYDPSSRGCIISDIRMPGMSGLDLQHELNQRACTLPIIFITGHGDIPMAVEAIKSGAVDFHTKPFRDQSLLDSINKAIEFNKILRRDMDQKNSIHQRLATLTPREREVLELVIAGKVSKVIADKLQLSPRTVETHRAHMMEKMQVATLTELGKLVQLVQ